MKLLFCTILIQDVSFRSSNFWQARNGVGRGECAQLVNDLSLSQLPSPGFDLCAPAPWAGVTQKKKKLLPLKKNSSAQVAKLRSSERGGAGICTAQGSLHETSLPHLHGVKEEYDPNLVSFSEHWATSFFLFFSPSLGRLLWESDSLPAFADIVPPSPPSLPWLNYSLLSLNNFLEASWWVNFLNHSTRVCSRALVTLQHVVCALAD